MDASIGYNLALLIIPLLSLRLAIMYAARLISGAAKERGQRDIYD